MNILNIRKCVVLAAVSALAAGNLRAQDYSVYDGEEVLEKVETNSTSAVSKVSGESLYKTPASNFTNTLIGIPGLTVMQGTGSYEDNKAKWLVRGIGSYAVSDWNTAKIFVDGFEVNSEYLTGLSASEVESVEVLKDGAALALYGERGANGVIRITTKRGRIGNSTVTARMRYGVQTPDITNKPLGSYDFANLYNQAVSNDNGMVWSPAYSEDQLSAYRNGTAPDVDWYDAALKGFGQYADGGIVLNGGARNARYNVNLDYLNNSGILNTSNTDQTKNLGYQKFNLRANLDFNILKGRVGFVFDYYHKKTSDLLLNIPVEQTTGFSTQLANVGNVTNDGVEFAVNATLYQTKKFSWNASANIAHNRNEVTSLGGSQNQIISGNTIIRVGEALGTYYGWEFDGVVQKGDDLAKVPVPSTKTNVEYGDAKFVDQNGDGNVDQENDRKVLGSAQPKFTYGFASQLRYGNWDLSFNFQGSYGNKLYNQLEQALESPNSSYNGSVKLLDRWTENNPSTIVPKATFGNLYSLYLDSRYIEDASYLRLKNIQVGYNFQPRLGNGQKLGIYLYASAQNLLTITDYTGFDPEFSGYTDRGTYPTARSFTFGLKISY